MSKKMLIPRTSLINSIFFPETIGSEPETIGSEETPPKFGILTSPNYPQNYPSSHDSTQTIRVAEGKTIQIRFTDFFTEQEYDYVEINDGDGTSLLPRESGSWGGPVFIVTKTNKALVKFHTDGDKQWRGWSLEWSECKLENELMKICKENYLDSYLCKWMG